MRSAKCELGGLQIERAKLVETGCADAGELDEELRQGFALAFLDVAQAVEFVEGSGFAVVEDATSARKPVFLVGVGQMADDIGNGEGAFAFVAVSPGRGKIAEERIKSGGRALEERNRVGEVVIHSERMLRRCGTMQKRERAKPKFRSRI